MPHAASSENRARRWKHWIILAAISVSSVAAGWVLGYLPFFRLLHLKTGDLHFLARGSVSPSEVVLLVVDQKSLDEFPEPLLFWHPYYAEAIRSAAGAGAKVLAIDITFPIPVKNWAPDNDQLLAEAFLEASSRMPVICGYVPSTLNRQADWPVPLNIAAAALNLNALLNLRVDPDDFIRSVELIEEPSEDQGATPARSLALRLAEKYRGVEARFQGGKLLLGDQTIPLSAERTMTINYPGPAGTFPRISLSDFVEAARSGRKEQLREWVGGKAVLLGRDGLDDRHATPFYTLTPGVRANTAGVEVHASALYTLLTRKFLVPAAPPLRMAALSGAAFVTAVAAGSSAGWTLAALLGGGVVLTILATHLLFRAGWVLSTSEILFCALLALLLTLVYRFLSAERRSDFFNRAIALFAGKKVAKTLSETETLALSGTRQNVTILFSDIRGFTAFSDEKDPAEVVELLNEYFHTMVGIIVRHHGYVNKFIGDGIMAIFSDEDGTVPGDHAVRAVRCGWEMVRQTGQFRTGVGIHSGEAIVGNVGSEDKMEYTALGDTVNFASRLESLNKEHKTQLLMSGATAALLKGEMETTDLGEVQVRGKSARTKIYTVRELVRHPPEAAVSAKQS